jgi:hypothetical protein
MVDCLANYFPPRATPSAGLAADQIMSAANPGLHPWRSKFRPFGQGANRKYGYVPIGKDADKHITF